METDIMCFYPMFCAIYTNAFHTVICPKERVRLVGGSPEHQGQENQEAIVEVCSNGRWGTVQTSQPQQVARELCRRLNFNEMNGITSDGKKSISHETI